jgi:WXG100 family type VII secretion target
VAWEEKAMAIRIDPAKVEQVAGQFSQKSQESQAMIAQLKTAVSGMSSEWEGMTAQRFFSDYENWNKQMQAHVALLESISTQLKACAQRFRTADTVSGQG